MPVIWRCDDDRVDVLVVEDPPEILDEAGLERGHVCQLLVVDPRGGQVRVDVAESLDLHVRKSSEPALQRIALAADADAGQDHAIVGPDHTPADDGRRAGVHAEQLASGHQAGRGAEARREFAP